MSTPDCLCDATLGPSGVTGWDPAGAVRLLRYAAALGGLLGDRTESLRPALAALEAGVRRPDGDGAPAPRPGGDAGVRLGHLAEVVARLHGADVRFAAQLRLAAPLCEVGKVGVPERVLRHRGPMSDDDRVLFNAHPVVGAVLLGSGESAVFRLAAEVALGHRECWDGGGFPCGLAGVAIPIAARVVAVAEAWDAAAAGAAPRQAAAAACERLRGARGRALDPDLVDTVLAHADEVAATHAALLHRPPGFDDLLRGAAGLAA